MVLDIPSLDIASGEQLFLVGPSGSGKTSLLNLLGGVAVPEAGSIRLFDTDLATLRPAARDACRADRIGFIFQQFNLLPWLTGLANVTLACRFSARRRESATAEDGGPEAAARRLLTGLGLADIDRPAAELSVGQQQRVAAARALIGGPDLVIADEPTSALDTANRMRFLELLSSACRATGATLVFVSHDEGLASAFDRTLDMRDINRAMPVGAAS
jgi:putative ABC transport system ATP-binding protein